MIFENDAVAFFCRTHDPWYVKKLKLEILAAIASSTNVYDIVTELTEYARDISPTMAREAVKAVGRAPAEAAGCHAAPMGTLAGWPRGVLCKWLRPDGVSQPGSTHAALLRACRDSRSRSRARSPKRVRRSAPRVCLRRRWAASRWPCPTRAASWSGCSCSWTVRAEL
jgi:hypothetical protein